MSRSGRPISAFLLHPDPSDGLGAPPPAGDHDSLMIQNDRAIIDSVQDRVIDAADHLGYSTSAQFALRLALEEALVNAFKHGHKGLPESTPVKFEFDVTPHRILVTVEDQGPGFQPKQVPDPTLDENLERPSGRGLVLMRAYMTRIEHNDRGNRVEMELIKPESED